MFVYAWCTCSRFVQEVGSARRLRRMGRHTTFVHRDPAMVLAMRVRCQAGRCYDAIADRFGVCVCVADTATAVRMAVALDALSSACDARRHGSTSAPLALCVAQLKEIGRRHTVVCEPIQREREV